MFGTIIFILVFYFGPRQEKYYLDQDIKQFKTVYLVPTLIWTLGILSFGLFVFWLIKTKSFNRSVIWFLSTILTFSFIIFFFQNILLGLALFANRQIKGEKVIKTYHASFMAGTDNSKSNFILYDASTKHITSDKKLVNELYQEGIKENDTLQLTMNEGLLGVTFKSNPFHNKR